MPTPRQINPFQQQVLTARRSVMRTSGRFAFYLRASGVCCLILIFELMGIAARGQGTPVPGGAVQVPCSGILRDTPDRCRAEIAAHQKLELLVRVPQGAVRALSIEQTLGTVHVTVTAAGDPAGAARDVISYSNLAGLHARIRILLGAGEAAGWRLTIDNSRSTKTSAVVVRAGESQPADARTLKEQEAEKALATAEMLRLRRSSSSAEAGADYDKAIATWRALGDLPDVGRALCWKAVFLFLHQNDPEAALPLVAEATKLTGGMDLVEAGSCWKTAAFLNAQQTHYDAAREDYRIALKDFTETGDVFNQEVLLDNLSRLEKLEGNHAAALRDDRQAYVLAEKISDARGELGIEEEIGSIHTSAGELEPAYDAFEKALILLERAPDPYMEGYVWSDMGVLYTQMGDYGRAQDALDHAAVVWKASHNSIGAMETVDARGDLQVAEGDTGAARQSYERGLGMAEKSKSDRYKIAFLRGIGGTYLLQGRDDPAEKNLREALDLATRAKEGDTIGPIHCGLGEIALHRDDKAEARRQYERCAAAAVQDPMLKIRAQGGLARLAYENGDLEKAETHCESALAGIELQRGSLRVQDLRTSYFASMHSYYELYIEILAALNREHPNEGYRWKAFLGAERDRARTLLDEVAANDGDRFTGGASALEGEYDQVQRRLRSLENARREAQRGNAASAEHAIARLTVEEHALHEEIAADGEAGEGSSSAAALTLRRIQAALPDRHSALIEYWTGADGSYAWGISAAGVRMERLPSAARLHLSVTEYRRAVLEEVSLPPAVTAEERAQLIPAARRRARLLATELARTLFPPGLIAAGTTTLLIVGDGPILSVPFAALMVPGARPGAVTFLNEPSTAVFSYLESRPADTRPMRIAVFTDAASGAESRGEFERTGLPGSGGSSGDLPVLRFATGEAATIRSVLGPAQTRVFTDESAAALRSFDWNAYSIGHFAMHAVLNDHYAELNGLVAGGGSRAGMLWYGDVCRLHARLDLVVLSACDTALGDNVPGEGLQGLTQAFFAAGSQRVLGTLWQVDDEATSVWMREFYLALKETGSPARALRIAQQAMAANPQWSAPYYWAGFTLAGDWRPLTR